MFYSQQHLADSPVREHPSLLPMSQSVSSPTDFTQAHVPRSAHESTEPIDPYALPNDRELLVFVTQFFATIGMVLPYIDNLSLLLDSRQPSSKQPWLTSRPRRALLNIVCAHAAFTQHSEEAEVFYQRTLACLTEKTLRGSSLELGKPAVSHTITPLESLDKAEQVHIHLKSRLYFCYVASSRILNALLQAGHIMQQR